MREQDAVKVEIPEGIDRRDLVVVGLSVGKSFHDTLSVECLKQFVSKYLGKRKDLLTELVNNSVIFNCQ